MHLCGGERGCLLFGVLKVTLLLTVNVLAIMTMVAQFAAQPRPIIVETIAARSTGRERRPLLDDELEPKEESDDYASDALSQWVPEDDDAQQQD